MDFSKYSTRSEFAEQINAGYSARLDGTRLSDNPHLVWHDQPGPGPVKQVGHMDSKAMAWQHGWRLADKDQKRTAR